MALLYSKKDKDLAYAGEGYWKYKDYWSYQWAWEFLRRNPKYRAFYPKCKAAYDKIVEKHHDPENPREGLQAYWGEFSFTKEYKILKKEFGLIYPEDPDKYGKYISPEIWAPEHFLNIIPADHDELEDTLGIDREYTFAVIFDVRRPIDFQVEETRKLLEGCGCATHVTHILPQNFRKFMDTYDQYTALQKDLGRKPKNYEMSAALYPGEWAEIERQLGDHDADLLNNFGNKCLYDLGRAKDYIEKKGYLDLLRWRPNPEHFEVPKAEESREN